MIKDKILPTVQHELTECCAKRAPFRQALPVEDVNHVRGGMTSATLPLPAWNSIRGHLRNAMGGVGEWRETRGVWSSTRSKTIIS